jgi:hypothetical protein
VTTGCAATSACRRWIGTACRCNGVTTGKTAGRAKRSAASRLR